MIFLFSVKRVFQLCEELEKYTEGGRLELYRAYTAEMKLVSVIQ